MSKKSADETFTSDAEYVDHLEQLLERMVDRIRMLYFWSFALTGAVVYLIVAGRR